MNKWITIGTLTVMMLVATGCNSSGNTQIASDTNTSTASAEANNQTTHSDTSIAKDHVTASDSKELSDHDYNLMGEYMDKTDKLMQRWDTELFAMQATIDALTNYELGEVETEAKFRQHQQAFHGLNSELKLISAPDMESGYWGSVFNNFHTNFVGAPAAAEDAAQYFVEAFEYQDESKAKRGSESWERAWAYYDQTNDSLDEMTKQMRLLKAQQ
ncbi:hypothetical protein [Paenibacillus sp. WLX2291]|uniref:hypothetical protein n=1 Tax=Paenibacillus sp. WLX2291 TaxID=3296934 RepID=UPI003983DFCA